MNTKLSSLDEIIFEQKDVEIFKIPDIKTRISTVQNYFFPRLEFLLRHSLDLVQDIYEVNPYETMTFVYKPSNRKNAKENFDFDEAHIGISAKRNVTRPLTIKHPDGKPFFLHPTYLTFNITPEGGMYVNLLPFRQKVDRGFIEKVNDLFRENRNLLAPIFSLNHISYTPAHEFIPLEKLFIAEGFESWEIELYSSTHFFPLNFERGLASLVTSFIALYPLVDSFVSIGEGREPCLAQMIHKFMDWYLEDEEDEEESNTAEPEQINIPELEGYTFIRAGLWWSVLARDNWTCCSCGRTPADGITLEVDHILPRSKGGTDTIENLQTLCKKCNIGKSNKDSTDLRF